MMETITAAYTAAPAAKAGQHQKEAQTRPAYDRKTSRVSFSVSHHQRKGNGALSMAPSGAHDVTGTLRDATHAPSALQRLLMLTDATLSVAEFQRLCEAACDVHSQPAWNWCVRLGSALSVATTLGAVYVRCGRLTLTGALS